MEESKAKVNWRQIIGNTMMFMSGVTWGVFSDNGFTVWQIAGLGAGSAALLVVGAVIADYKDK